MPGFIEHDQWKSFLDEFSKRNQFRATRLEVVGDVGAQEEEKFLPLLGVSLETKGSAEGSVEVLLGGESVQDERHVDHLITNVRRIAPLLGNAGFEDGLGFEDQDGVKTLLTFQRLAELPETTSTTSTRA
jgi:hypothetical protein